jgi:hypothetical protein
MAQKRVFPKIIRKISIQDNTEEITIEKTYDEYNHFYLVPNKVNVYDETNDITNTQFIENTQDDLDLPPPPPPTKLMRSFHESDRQLYDPLYVINKDYKYLGSSLGDDFKKKFLLRHINNSKNNQLERVQLVTQKINTSPYSQSLLYFWSHYKWIDFEWFISNDHKTIQYFIPRQFSSQMDEYFINSSEDFNYISVIYKSLFSALIKFKIILHRIRIKKRIRLFLLSTQPNHSILLNRFKGSSNLPIRKTIIDYLTTTIDKYNS